MHELTPAEIEELIKLDEPVPDEQWQAYCRDKLNRKEFVLTEEGF